MSELTAIKAGLPAHLEPEAVKANQARANAIIDFAAKVKDWPVLGEAVDRKIEDQEEFVRWWRENVGKNWGGDRSKNADAEYLLSVDQAQSLTGILQPQVSRWGKALSNKDKYREQLIAVACKKAGLRSADNHRAEGTGENEWYTPAKFIEAAREVMGGIDLDPASHPAAQTTIQAEVFLTRMDDGLSKEWHGRVWLNPPYSQPEIWHFVEKLVEELSADRATEAVLLTHNYTDTAWFHHAESIAAAICFTRGRIPFEDMDGEKCAPTQGQAFFYFGENVDRFREVFAEFGFVR